MCGLICLSDVALKLLKRYQNLPKESLSVYNFPVPKLLRESLSLNDKILELDSNQEPVPVKFSALVALAKMPSAFPSGNQFSHREQFIYDGKFSHLSPYDRFMIQHGYKAVELKLYRVWVLYGSSGYL
jgi:hypothetical protein